MVIVIRILRVCLDHFGKKKLKGNLTNLEYKLNLFTKLFARVDCKSRDESNEPIISEWLL